MKRSRLFGLPLAIAIPCAVLAESDIRPHRRVSDLKYDDQFGVEHTLTFPSDRPRVLVLADREGSAQIASWVEPLVARYGERIEIRGIALLAGVPAWLRPTLRSLFRRRLSYPILMDWDGASAAKFDYGRGAALVVAVDAEGDEVWRAAGPADAERLAEAFRQLDALTPEDEENLGPSASVRKG